MRRTNIASQPAIHECYVYKSRTWLVSKNLCFWRIHVSIIWVSHCFWYHLNRQHTSHTCCFSKSLKSLFLLGRSWTHGAFLVRSMCVDSITSFLVDIISYAPMLRKLSRSLVISLLREPWIIVLHFPRFCSMWLFFLLIWNIFVTHTAMNIVVCWILWVLRKYQAFSPEELWHTYKQNP